MRVFNLTAGSIDFKGKVIPAFGSQEYPDLRFVTTRDLALQGKGLLAFGSLPKGWRRPVSQEPSPLVISVMKATAEVNLNAQEPVISLESNPLVSNPLVAPMEIVEKNFKKKKW